MKNNTMTLYRLVSEDWESGAEVGKVVSVSGSKDFQKRAKSEYKRVEKLEVKKVL